MGKRPYIRSKIWWKEAKKAKEVSVYGPPFFIWRWIQYRPYGILGKKDGIKILWVDETRDRNDSWSVIIPVSAEAVTTLCDEDIAFIIQDKVPSLRKGADGGPPS